MCKLYNIIQYFFNFTFNIQYNFSNIKLRNKVYCTINIY